ISSRPPAWCATGRSMSCTPCCTCCSTRKPRRTSTSSKFANRSCKRRLNDRAGGDIFSPARFFVTASAATPFPACRSVRIHHHAHLWHPCEAGGAGVLLEAAVAPEERTPPGGGDGQRIEQHAAGPRGGAGHSRRE